MKLIEKASFLLGSYLQIEYDEGFIAIENRDIKDYKGIRFSKTGVCELFKHYQSYSKTELLEAQYILLNAYVFANDVLDKSIEDSESKEKLDEDKKLVLVIRKHLRYMTTYIDAYEELVNEYKDA